LVAPAPIFYRYKFIGRSVGANQIIPRHGKIQHGLIDSFHEQPVFIAHGKIVIGINRVVAVALIPDIGIPVIPAFQVIIS
jgi:hypothetical protein